MKQYVQAALALFFALSLSSLSTAAEPTYAERLGWGPHDKVVLFHTDDVGMSHSSNAGAIEALEKGVAKSFSIMMPCPWVPEIKKYLEKHPDTDSGLHLTLTSEWDLYRWGPVVGKPAAPGLADPDGYLWDNVGLVAQHASADEVEAEIRAQIERAEDMGIPITHIDSHMGTLFHPKFMERYIKVGIEKQLPVLAIGGHMQYAAKENPETAPFAKQLAQRVWDAGLPVLDDVHTASYDWKTTDKTDHFIEFLRTMKPGVTEVILHCSRPSDVFPLITTSGDLRLGDLNAMIDPRLHKVIKEEGIIVTTWKELKERRDKVGR